jgi:hypothetical protein
MFRNSFSLIIKAMVLTFTLMSITQLTAQFGGGSGTQIDPYQVSSPGQLNNIRDYLNYHFIQTADIDMNVAPYNAGLGWNPIGLCSGPNYGANVPFMGSYNGNGFTISNFYTNWGSYSYIALFRYTWNATLSNIRMTNCRVYSSGTSVAALISEAYGTTIDNCYVSGTVQGGDTTGGMVSDAVNCIITNCTSICNVYSIRQYAGGLAAWISNGVVSDSHSEGFVQGTKWVGGMAGRAMGTDFYESYSSAKVHCLGDASGGLIGIGFRFTADRCYAIGDVTGGNLTGGFIGSMDWSGISNSFARGNVSGEQVVGGFAGEVVDYSTIKYSYSTGEVIGTALCGGFAGVRAEVALAPDCYWNSETSGQTTSCYGQAANTIQMTYPYSPISYVEWDFQNTWANDENGLLNDGYPIFGYMIPVANDDDVIPSVPDIALSNYPNPFTESTSIRFDIPKSGKVSLSIYNSKGQLVRTLTDGNYSKGEHTLTWDGKSDNGQQVSNGIYLYRLHGTDFRISKKLLLSK